MEPRGRWTEKVCEPLLYDIWRMLLNKANVLAYYKADFLTQQLPKEAEENHENSPSPCL
jgi:hypothetical protein